MKTKAAVILFVEDEFLLCEELMGPLMEAGVNVLTQSKGDDAIQTLVDRAEEISALITDVSLADKTTGWEVARKAREINPGLPVIFTTSYSAETWAANGVPNSVHIQKPFVAVQVVTGLAQLLNKSSTAGSQ